MKSNKGFTLIEVLVVLFIISIVTSVALLTISHNENRQVENVVKEFTQILSLAQEHALLKGTVFGLAIRPHAYQYFVYQEKKWVPSTDRLLSEIILPAAVTIRLHQKEDDDEEAMAVPRIIISTNGNMTPFKIWVGLTGKTPRYAITGEVDGSVNIESLP